MKKIIHVLYINSDQTDVFNAISTGKGLSKWWTTKVSAEERLGGIVDFTFRGDFNPDMKILVLNPPTEVRWECVSGHEPWQDNKFSFELSETNAGTQLKFTQDYSKEISDESYGIYNFNWGYYLQSLKDYCESGKGKPYAP